MPPPDNTVSWRPTSYAIAWPTRADGDFVGFSFLQAIVWAWHVNARLRLAREIASGRMAASAAGLLSPYTTQEQAGAAITEPSYVTVSRALSVISPVDVSMKTE